MTGYSIMSSGRSVSAQFRGISVGQLVTRGSRVGRGANQGALLEREGEQDGADDAIRVSF